jgi:hypothetical protein
VRVCLAASPPPFQKLPTSAFCSTACVLYSKGKPR